MIILLAIVAPLITVSCSDNYMNDMNTDPSKAATIDPNAQLTTAELQTYGDLSMVEIYRNYFYAFSQQLMGCWNTTNYGGRHTVDNQEMSRMWTTLYPNAIKNLTDGEIRTNGNNAKSNVNAAMRVYRVYLMSIITDTYGNVPYSEAGLGFYGGITNPKYDLQKDIYADFFQQLDTATTMLNAAGDKISGDVIYKGDVVKWKKLANSLRLRFAMRISDVEPDKAKTEFVKALNADGGIIENSADDALINYMSIAFSFGQESYSDFRGNALSKLLFGNDPTNNPSYICSTLFNQLNNNNDPRTFSMARCYYDKLMSSTGTENRIDITDEVKTNNKLTPNIPGAFSWEPWPTGFKSDKLTEIAKNNPSVDPNVAREVEPKLANNFLKSDNPGVIITSAEVDFLLAEATLKGWISNKGTVTELYTKGVRAAMDFLSDSYGCDKVSDADFNTYIANNDIGHTAEQAKAAINTQAWILHFTNPAECWANVRRSGYPAMKSPKDYGFGQYLTGGDDIPVRLCYPVLESSYNKQGYNDALQVMGGKDDWHTHVWWDVK
ncbi:MAG: SusD/RagB family nutrient-binding outer membrane lipoprotein [Prevotella sp.]|nr:SusD/RagB family nutrient-binding outer membrane lipoprotein [Prevotella sp.]MBP8686090.1 SusD/RagB family nutrient-binding outer membrane lipoprotein [Prevotella sp.]